MDSTFAVEISVAARRAVLLPPHRMLDAVPGDLPAQGTSLIARERDLDRVIALRHRARLLTLTRLGEVGKTRLGLQAAAEHLSRNIPTATLARRIARSWRSPRSQTCHFHELDRRKCPTGSAQVRGGTSG
jgi:hypothetical protein